MEMQESNTGELHFRATTRAKRVPRGRAPRGFANWDAADSVWRNDEGDTVFSKRERQARANRECRQRKKVQRLAHRTVLSTQLSSGEESKLIERA